MIRYHKRFKYCLENQTQHNHVDFKLFIDVVNCFLCAMIDNQCKKVIFILNGGIMDGQKKLKIRYVEENKPAQPVNGALGGLSSDGLLVVKLYFDRKALPVTAQIEHIEHNLFGNEQAGEFEADADIIREVASKLTLTPKAAVAVGKWLVKKGEEAQKMGSGK